MTGIFARFVNDDRGATAVEYGIIAAMISMVVIAGVSAVFNGVSKNFNMVGDQLNNVTSQH